MAAASNWIEYEALRDSFLEYQEGNLKINDPYLEKGPTMMQSGKKRRKIANNNPQLKEKL